MRCVVGCLCGSDMLYFVSLSSRPLRDYSLVNFQEQKSLPRNANRDKLQAQTPSNPVDWVLDEHGHERDAHAAARHDKYFD